MFDAERGLSGMTQQQERMMQLLQSADEVFTNQIYYAALAIADIQPDEEAHPAAQVSCRPSVQ